MKTHLKSKSETSKILKIISKLWNKEIPKIKNLKSYYIDNDSEILIADSLKILKLGHDFIPFLSETKITREFSKGHSRYGCSQIHV